jgi:hypothetical protein
LPAYEKSKDAKEKMLPLLRLKHNSQIFETLLSRQKTTSNDPGGLGILLGNPQAKNRIIKVCNPYCGPCALAHADLDALMDGNPDLQVQIIFTATSGEGDAKAPPVRHLMAISEKGEEQLTRRALDDWYQSASKGYTAFAARYPMNGELKRHDGKLDAMSKWCQDTGIEFTPTLFVNGYQLPDMYTVGDLMYFLAQS